MSGWNPFELKYELTPKKVRYYFRRHGFDTPEDCMSAHGLKNVLVTRYGYSVQATIAQIWTALSGQPSDIEPFRHEGAILLINAGLYTKQQYIETCGHSWFELPELLSVVDRRKAA
jgi:hypothetical protein